ncbi:MAG: type II CAAX endopeptidase family protein [Myxococcota bacterium]|nr:type II CAAX endopeptidase family protein [Myxococcota bacterium]
MERESPPSTRDVIVSLGVAFAALILVSLMGVGALGAVGVTEPNHPAVSATLLVLTPTTIGICAISFARLHSSTPWDLLAIRWGKYWGLFVGVVCAGVLSEGIYTWIQSHASDLDGGAVDQLGEAVQAGGVSGGFILLGALVLAPVGEELFFRGWIFGAIERRSGSMTAIGVSSLAFAGYHMDPAHALAILPLAVWISWLRAISGGLGACVLAHMLNNGIWVFSTRAGTEEWDFFPWLGPLSAVGLAAMVGFVAWQKTSVAQEQSGLSGTGEQSG